jgi:hypothetical protein
LGATLDGMQRSERDGVEGRLEMLTLTEQEASIMDDPCIRRGNVKFRWKTRRRPYLGENIYQFCLHIHNQHLLPNLQPLSTHRDLPTLYVSKRATPPHLSHYTMSPAHRSTADPHIVISRDAVSKLGDCATGRLR